jgi:hypothetical protein
MFLAIFTIHPAFAIFPAFGFLLLDRLRPSLLVRSVAVAWLIYGVYEYLMLARVLCSGECNIRVDLLIIYPVLLILSVAAIIKFARAPRATA